MDAQSGQENGSGDRDVERESLLHFKTEVLSLANANFLTGRHDHALSATGLVAMKSAQIAAKMRSRLGIFVGTAAKIGVGGRARFLKNAAVVWPLAQL
ncbi:hypothetical protein K239x_01380 [Planctomycetes bacterium K23_9]|uniref:Uncharacterized protein n=1 Tax=Stieleria marina TaxID=1930275 RepID=A0A517NM41_9BACT|nr:hypothetical protein K239x_01380 [Planctomycetes bacterium K23_9]